jgi:hypothetical protein
MTATTGKDRELAMTRRACRNEVRIARMPGADVLAGMTAR